MLNDLLTNSDEDDIQYLQRLCLLVLVSNFSEFVRLFRSNNIVFRSISDFVQRNYSGTLLRELCIRRLMRVEYVQFLFSHHLQKLALGSVLYSYASPILNRLQVIGETICSFKISDNSWTDSDIIAILNLIPKVKAISFCSSQCSDKVLWAITSHCPLVQVLNIQRCPKVTDAGLKFLCPVKADKSLRKNHILRKLGVRKSGITKEGIQFSLEHFPKLEEVEYFKLSEVICEIWDKIHSSKLPPDFVFPIFHLRNVDFHFNKYKEASIPGRVQAISTLCPKIVYLLATSVTSTSHVDLFMNFTHLEEICCQGEATTTPVDFSNFFCHMGKNLVSVQLSHIACSSAFLLCKYCPRLQGLRLYSVYFEDHVDEAIAQSYSNSLSCLKFLEFEKMDFEVPGNLHSFCLLVSSSPRLEILALRECKGVYGEMLKTIERSRCINNMEILLLVESGIKLGDMMKLVRASQKLSRLILSNLENMREYEPLLRLCSQRNCEVFRDEFY